MASRLLSHFRTHICDLLRDISLSPQHHILDLFQILFVLIELLLECHGSVDLLLKIDLSLVSFLVSCLELLSVIAID